MVVFRPEGDRLFRALSVASGLVLAVTLIQVPQASSAEVDLDTESRPSKVIPACERTDRMKNRRTIDHARIYTRGEVRIDSWSVSFTNQRWRAQHPTNAALTQYFHSSTWLVPDDDADLPRAIGLLVAQAAANPDPGSQRSRGNLGTRGWNESAVTLRLTTVLCVYHRAGSKDREQLRPVLNGLIYAAKDANRYYGPPTTKAHNHGVMSDRILLESANILDTPELARFAEGRLLLQLNGLYDSCGLTYEQSNGYQHFHASLWRQVASEVTSPEFRLRIRKQLNKLRDGANALTWSDGMSPPIGNGRTRFVSDLSRVSNNVSLFCPETGWFSRRTIRANLTQQVLARFGPATAFHGHNDKGSIFWWVGKDNTGTQVLVDRGLSGKNEDSRRAYSESSAAHPTLIWPGGSGLRMSGRESRRGSTTTLTVRGSAGSSIGTWRRTVTMNSTRARLVIRDTVTGPSADAPATSNLPLDPTWRPTRTPGVFTSTAGGQLTIACTTHRGDTVPVRHTWTQDFQLEKTRRGVTATCTVPAAGKGLIAVLRVVE